MEVEMTAEDMLHTLYEIQMRLFIDQCDLLFGPMEDILKGESLEGGDFEAA